MQKPSWCQNEVACDIWGWHLQKVSMMPGHTDWQRDTLFHIYSFLLSKKADISPTLEEIKIKNQSFLSFPLNSQMQANRQMKKEEHKLQVRLGPTLLSLSSHLLLNRGGHWGTTDDLAASLLLSIHCSGMQKQLCKPHWFGKISSYFDHTSQKSMANAAISLITYTCYTTWLQQSWGAIASTNACPQTKKNKKTKEKKAVWFSHTWIWHWLCLEIRLCLRETCCKWSWQSWLLSISALRNWNWLKLVNILKQGWLPAFRKTSKHTRS